MEKFIKNYQGAAVYEIFVTKEPGAQPIGYRIIAKAILPGEGNLSVDFIEQAGNREKAIKQIELDIDQYLMKHNLREFN